MNRFLVLLTFFPLVSHAQTTLQPRSRPITYLSLSAPVSGTLAVQSPQPDRANIRICTPSRKLLAHEQPLVVVDDKAFPYDSLGTLNPKLIQSVMVYKDAKAKPWVRRFGGDAKNGVIVLMMK